VPTPVNQDHTPDLSPVVSASSIVGRNLQRGSYVVFESTVYPGVTEDVCQPILERESGLKCGVDFWIGYSPERINPGDKVHTLENIRKIVSGMDAETCQAIADVYNLVITAGTYSVSTIRTAEAVKVVENSQRDINIAFMNELAIVFDRMGIDTNEVVAGMNTKWNALRFQPGLVGGHCIGVDPYYFIYEASVSATTVRSSSPAERSTTQWALLSPTPSSSNWSLPASACWTPKSSSSASPSRRTAPISATAR
jgi:UDP-N-acetyl-D-galactosamine dehydrogenase